MKQNGYSVQIYEKANSYRKTIAVLEDLCSNIFLFSQNYELNLPITNELILLGYCPHCHIQGSRENTLSGGKIRCKPRGFKGLPYLGSRQIEISKIIFVSEEIG